MVDRETTDEEKQLPSRDRPVETLTRGEKKAISERLEAEARSEGGSKTYTETEKALVESSTDLQKAISSAEKERFENIIEGRDVEVIVSDKSPETGGTRTKEYIDAKTKQVLAIETQEGFRIRQGLSFAAPREEREVVLTPTRTLKETPELMTKKGSVPSVISVRDENTGLYTLKVVQEVDNLPFKQNIEQDLISRELYLKPKQDSMSVQSTIEFIKSETNRPNIEIDFKKLNEENRNFEISLSSFNYTQETQDLLRKQSEVKGSLLGVIPFFSFNYDAELKASKYSSEFGNINLLNLVSTGGGEGTKIDYKPFNETLTQQKELERQIERTQNIQRIRYGSEAFTYYGIGVGVTNLALKFGAKGVTALKIVDFVDDIYDTYEAVLAGYKISKGDIKGGGEELLRLASSNYFARLGSVNTLSNRFPLRPVVTQSIGYDLDVNTDYRASQFESNIYKSLNQKPTPIKDTKPFRYSVTKSEIVGFEPVSPAYRTDAGFRTGTPDFYDLSVEQKPIIEEKTVFAKNKLLKIEGYLENGEIKPFRYDVKKNEFVSDFLTQKPVITKRDVVDFKNEFYRGFEALSRSKKAQLSSEFYSNQDVFSVKTDKLVSYVPQFESVPKELPIQSFKGDFIPRIKQKIDNKEEIEQLVKTREQVLPKYETKFDTKQETKQEPISLLKNQLKTEFKSSFDIKPDNRYDAKSDFVQDIRADTKADFTPDFKAEIKADLRVDLRTDQKIDYSPKFDPDFRPPDFKFPTPSFSFGLSNKEKGFFRPLESGFDVFVRKGGEFFKQNVRPLTKLEALNLGFITVDTSSAATFKIKETDQKVFKTNDRLNFNSLKFDKIFDTKKEDGDTIFIEKKKFRISTLGELEDITFKRFK